MSNFLNVVVNRIKDKWWYCVLLTLSSLYVFCYRYDIYKLSELNAKNLIFLVWLILLLLPLLSEVEIFGVKIKKEIEEAKSEIKALGIQINELKLSNSNVTNNYLGPMPSKEEVEKYSPKIYIRNENHSDSFRVENGVPQENLYLFQIRYNIERLLRELCDKHGYGPGPLPELLLKLKKINVISDEYFNLIIKTNSITNRGVHGEIISNEYIEFVKNIYPKVREYLENCIK